MTPSVKESRNHSQAPPFRVDLSTSELKLQPNGSDNYFYVDITNLSQNFASFYLELEFGNQQVRTIYDKNSWYTLMPTVSSKIPPGGYTRFQVNIKELPLAYQQLSSPKVPVLLRIRSPEWGHEWHHAQTFVIDTSDLGEIPIEADFVDSPISVIPGESTEIAVRVNNPNPSNATVLLKLQVAKENHDYFHLSDLPNQQIGPHSAKEFIFDCTADPQLQISSRIYAIDLILESNFNKIRVPGEISLQPTGAIALNCENADQTVPQKSNLFFNPAKATAAFNLTIHNQMNRSFNPKIDIQYQTKEPLFPWLNRLYQRLKQKGGETLASPKKVPYEIDEHQEILHISKQRSVQLRVTEPLPWFGFGKNLIYISQLQDESLSGIDTTKTTQKLTVRLRPRVPIWLQYLLSSILVIAIIAAKLGSFKTHKDAVKFVQFNGQGTEVLSASDDQTFMRWQIQGKRLKLSVQSVNLERALRVIRYRPIDNNQVAIGYENGEISLINLLNAQATPLSIPSGKDDRVFDLVFNQNSTKLYSAHGSGAIFQWDLNQLTNNRLGYRIKEGDKAIRSITLLENDRYLAIGGRENSLQLIRLYRSTAPNQKKLSRAVPISVAYPSGSQSDYITSLDTAILPNQNLNLLAVGDNQGKISLWSCQNGQCKSLIRPWMGHGGSPINAVSLTSDGCFLATAANDGRVKLWPLNQAGFRRANFSEGIDLLQQKAPINAVDVIQINNKLWIASGGNNAGVKLHQRKLGQPKRNRCSQAVED
ncbi:hypothetical protein IQ266_21920 [filamentous cyanobacterium LEGE 11480]|uniref:Uncharacterized protein n=1 Tax=Romeriopsis navalis LEGE 11480 TaxID=2777977 RepID=A0A928VQ21_9CYAN|nr:hypothetical protein [Romeriopsis navalis]MBE9032400.1 hypothetical protein [Romeriopsis navalis LEGE 11480]